VIENILGYKVKHVVNITDVGHLTDDGDQGEDKLEKASKKENKTAYDIAKEYENIFYDYLKKLNIKFDVHPKATEHIQEQIDLVKKLEEKGYTYVIEDDGIYMDTLKVKDY
jgi:cysteinyl-tRNA synthetase